MTTFVIHRKQQLKSSDENFELINFMNGSQNYHGFSKNLCAEFAEWPLGIYDLYCRIPGALLVLIPLVCFFG